MNKLGSKEIFLILVVINFLLYYLAYMCVISPLRNTGKEYKEQITTLQQQYDEQKAIVDSKDQYIATIDQLKKDKETLFTESFPDAETENIHAYMVDRAKACSIVINSITIGQDVATVADPQTGEQVPTGLKNNTINVSVTGSYANIIKLITDMENVKKTSLLTSFSLAGNPASMTTSLNYSLLTVDKGEDIVDPTFDHTFGQGKGGTVLFD